MLRSETGEDPARLRDALAGLNRYQSAPRPPRREDAPVVARVGRAMLRDYGGSGLPAVFVPSLINPPHVLDLAEDNSLLRWLAARNVRPLLVDWGTPGPDERALDIAGHVDQLLLPLLRAVQEPVALVGYCLGGTMAIAAAAHHPVRSLALIATPWQFTGFPISARDNIAGLWQQVAPTAEALGVLPMEALQASFWRLDPARTIRKFEDFGRLPTGDPRIDSFIALEDWANDGPPLTLAAGRELLADLFGANTTGRGAWQVGGNAIDPASVTCPVLNIISLTDRIVPAATAPGIGQSLALGLGHVGMIVGSRARQALWEPLQHWLSQPRER
ncbi:alpha/beta fold hydrolase [Sphingomonas sp. KC8]|uniref:alpha/beta fold hydrolase n=1 Tax=Sphingomonas sp. KC8 TaxID=1030157 RepID=UPI0002488A7A|nr:alpha/beta fold hydrolase [Sphingomonas sp. KC8]ARS25851.1 Poly(3-hydroxyalkanoate) synthetase-like protein [Sphingomonas sp. KC8]